MTACSEMQLEEQDEQITDLFVMLPGNEHKHSKPRKKKEIKKFSERQDMVVNEEFCLCRRQSWREV